MYPSVLFAHSVLRWLVVGAGVGAVVFTVAANRRASDAGRASAAFGVLFTTFFDVQVLVGLALYLYFSPITAMTMRHMGGVMSNDILRFWAIEHPAGMLVALGFVHVGRVRQRSTDLRRRRRAALYFALALVVILLTIPWPFMPYGRPLL